MAVSARRDHCHPLPRFRFSSDAIFQMEFCMPEAEIAVALRQKEIHTPLTETTRNTEDLLTLK